MVSKCPRKLSWLTCVFKLDSGSPPGCVCPYRWCLPCPGEGAVTSTSFLGGAQVGWGSLRVIKSASSCSSFALDPSSLTSLMLGPRTHEPGLPLRCGLGSGRGPPCVGVICGLISRRLPQPAMQEKQSAAPHPQICWLSEHYGGSHGRLWPARFWRTNERLGIH